MKLAISTADKDMEALMEPLFGRCSCFVIIDTAPPQLTAEGSALARQVDGIILVVNYGSTHREVVKQLVEMLGKEKIIGIIVNRFNMRSSTYYGYVKRKKYEKYYHHDY